MPLFRISGERGQKTHLSAVGTSDKRRKLKFLEDSMSTQIQNSIRTMIILKITSLVSFILSIGLGSYAIYVKYFQSQPALTIALFALLFFSTAVLAAYRASHIEKVKVNKEIQDQVKSVLSQFKASGEKPEDMKAALQKLLQQGS